MILKRSLIWAVLLLFSSVVFSANNSASGQLHSHLCKKGSFFYGSSKVSSFCGKRINLPPYGSYLFPWHNISPGVFFWFNTPPAVFPWFNIPPDVSDLIPLIQKISDNKALILVSGGDLRKYSQKTITNHLLFAASQDMIYFYADIKNFKKRNGFLKPQWLKVQLLRDLLRDPYVPESSWIVWADDDLVFNLNIRDPLSTLDRYIAKYGDKASIIITNDSSPWEDYSDTDFNTGVIIVQKNDISRHFFAQWWHIRPRDIHNQERYNPPTQSGLQLLLKKQNYVASGVLKIAPQRTDWGNLNTFHLSENWKEEGLAKFNDEAVQHPGLDLQRKQQLVMHTLEALSYKSFPAGLSILIHSRCQPEQYLSTSLEQLENYLSNCLPPEQ